ncbi:Uncharacterised protein [Achromobacter spanius]|nr:hypothetical protein CVS48_28000 [Achromobacter spanius]MCS3508674.1 hypothetical protein [Achromobacter sp. JUb104]CAB3684873.1 hypothetical protein LMG5911_04173 [Achromobacter spanius]SPT37131.1 Uncharacterised protein [Achromobacter denitrificans]VEE58263.1 Uncharacterised protein [Achromobacter spanius]
MRVRGLEFRKRILGAAALSPSAALCGGAAFGYNQLASDMRRQTALGDTGGFAVSGVPLSTPLL